MLRLSIVPPSERESFKFHALIGKHKNSIINYTVFDDLCQYLYCFVVQNSLDFLGNFRSTVLLVSFAPGFVSLPCMTPSSAALETLFPAQNILRNTALLRFPRKSIDIVRMRQKNQM